MKHTPATPLPWSKSELAGFYGISGRIDPVGSVQRGNDAAYIAHAANAYPKLVRALIACSRAYGRMDADAEDARAILKELGELR